MEIPELHAKLHGWSPSVDDGLCDAGLWSHISDLLIFLVEAQSLEPEGTFNKAYTANL